MKTAMMLMLALVLLVPSNTTVSRTCNLDAAEHGGGLNACGCHINHKTGVCHCHRAPACGC